MLSNHFSPRSLYCRLRFMALFLCMILLTPAAWAVESGMLSITAEGVTAARAIFAQHPDPKVRNDDYLAMNHWNVERLRDVLEQR